MRAPLFAALLVLAFTAGGPAFAQTVTAPVPATESGTVVLTLDACGGSFDWSLAHLLVANQVPATLFVTRRWVDANPAAVSFLREHRALFTIENHGARHEAPVLGSARGPFGVPAVATKTGLIAEVAGGAQAVREAFGTPPHWFRGATARYSPEALTWLAQAGWGAAGYSIALDDGATLPAKAVAHRALAARPGDVLLGHINKPAGDTAEGLAQALPVLLSRGTRFGHLVRP
jgi:peptidoglycan/xylan/chitin deacetylase (PgdA/CDA1 family)